MPESMASETADARITRLIRAGHPSAPAQALARHRDAVLAHAGLYCPDGRDAHRLAEESLASTLDAVRAGAGPSSAWRPYLASELRRTAARWAGDDRAAGLSVTFTAWIAELPGADDPLSAATRADEASVLLRALRALPEHRQAALWRAVAEEPMEPDGPRPSAAAGDGLWEAYLQAFAQTADRPCRHLAAAMGDAVQHGTVHPSLDRHTASCERCRRARSELEAVHAWDVDVLYGALMLWTARRPSDPPAEAPPGRVPALALPAAAPAIPAGHAGTAPATVSAALTTAPRSTAAPRRTDERRNTDERRRDHRRLLVLCAGAATATVVVVVTVMVALPDGRPGTSEPISLSVPTLAAAPSTVGPASPTAEATPSTQEPTASTASTESVPVVPVTASTTRPAPASPTAPSPSVRPAGFRLLNTRSGLCVGPADAAGPYLALRPCNQDPSERWERIAAGGNTYQLRNTGTGNCLDGTDDGGNVVRVVQAACLPAAERTVQLWKFATEPDGTSFRLLFVPPVPGSDYAAHLLGPEEWAKTSPPSLGTPLTQLPDYYHSASFVFVADQGP
ncbi:RICIN domain-containing protein [Kitasatospora sp. NPDC088346]|uniref:RICIN domain-containing protein n=1 Tax=Kitasatospora sp. NPDC088346 TaxID=3364073 RepID=UPI003819C33A